MKLMVRGRDARVGVTAGGIASPPRRRWRGIALSALLALTAPPLGADEFLLKNGGRVAGIWLNWQDAATPSYEIRTEQGARLTLRREQVSIALRQSSAERVYEKRRLAYTDTVADHWRLAAWCGEQGLKRHRNLHLRRVVELDPTHAPARRALGYVQISGKWTTRRQILREKGYVLHEGQWRLPQEARILDERRQVQAGEGDWCVKIKRWRAQLSSDDARGAWNRLRAIRDPLAISALADGLVREQSRPVRLLYVDVLGEMDDDRALAVLIATSLRDSDREVFHACVDKIVARKTPELVKLFSRTLGDANNAYVNRAAYVLARLEDPAALAPLVEALATTHLCGLSGSGAVTVGFERRLSPPADGSFASAETAFDTGRLVTQGPDGGPTRVYRAVNARVLGALVKLSGGVNFGYDQAAWRRWLTVRGQSDRGTSDLQARSN